MKHLFMLALTLLLTNSASALNCQLSTTTSPDSASLSFDKKIATFDIELGKALLIKDDGTILPYESAASSEGTVVFASANKDDSNTIAIGIGQLDSAKSKMEVSAMAVGSSKPYLAAMSALGKKSLICNEQ